MITRRNLMATSAAAAVVGTLQPEPSAARPRPHATPLRAPLRVRNLHAFPSHSGRLILASDGDFQPRKLIRRDVLNAVFGEGTDKVLGQPDHWEMIDAGWFGDEDLYLPTGFDDPAYLDWCEYYDPRVQAHDLLFGFVEDEHMWWGGGEIPEVGLVFMRHPQSPRLVTAHFTDWSGLARLEKYLAERTQWLTLDPVIRETPPSLR